MGDVRVVVRFRPQQERELREGGEEVCKFEKTGKGVSMNGTRKANFTFDRVFNKLSTQEEVYNDAARPVVEDVLKGYNGTIFAYGQTSSGKTHTMEGADLESDMRGIIPRIVQEIFGYIQIAPESFEFVVRISYFEIYMEKIRDLLCDGSENLQIHESRDRGVYVRHATELYMQGPEDCLEVMRQGAARRMVAVTNMNDNSSRSHGVVLLELTQKDLEKGGSKTAKLYLVDLAGSEKVSKTGADGTTLDEAKMINKSLSALGLVIMTLTEGNSRAHIPYRDSKLTRILQESLGGNSRTTIICCCSPSSHNEDESLSTLNFAKRAKKVKNNAKINQQYSAEELQRKLDEAKKEIKKLVKKLVDYEAELNIWRAGGTVSEEDRVNLGNSENSKTLQDDEEVDKPLLGTSSAKAPVDNALADEERESFMQRESELLDLLDDKDEEIRMLEREMDQLAEEKITITKLAGENLGQKQQIEKLDSQIGDLQADNALYEGNIEELATMNEQVLTEKDFVQVERDELNSRVATLTKETNSQLQAIGDQIFGLLSVKPGGRQLPTPPSLSNIVTLPLDKAKSFVMGLQNDVKEAGANASSSEEVIAFKQNLTQLELSLEETKSELSKTTESKADLETENNVKEGKIEALEAQITDLIGKLLEVEQLLDERGIEDTENSSKKDLSEFQSMLLAEKDNLSKQVKTLKGSLEASQTAEKELTHKVNQLALDMNNEKAQVERLKKQLSEGSSKTISEAAQPLVETTNYKLEQFKNLREKMRQHILAKKAKTQQSEDSENSAHNTSMTKNTFFEDKLSEKKQELTTMKTDNRELKKKMITVESQNAEMKRRVQDKDAKYRRMMHERNQLDAKFKEFQQQHARSVNKAAVARRRTSNAQANQGVRGGGARQSAEGRNWNKINENQESVRRGAATAAVILPESENPEQVEYV